MSDIKFLGCCVVVAALLVASAIVCAAPRRASGRYQFHVSTPPGVIWTMDTATGEITTKEKWRHPNKGAF